VITYFPTYLLIQKNQLVCYKMGHEGETGYQLVLNGYQLETGIDWPLLITTIIPRIRNHNPHKNQDPVLIYNHDSQKT
jgi:hypothetical protein